MAAVNTLDHLVFDIGPNLNKTNQSQYATPTDDKDQDIHSRQSLLDIQLLCVLEDDSLRAATRCTITFWGDIFTDSATIGCSRDSAMNMGLTPDAWFAQLLHCLPPVQHLTLMGLSAYYKSIKYRQWEADGDLFTRLSIAGQDGSTELLESTDPSEQLGALASCTHLELRGCCLSDSDIIRLGPAFGAMHKLTMNGCAGFQQHVFETYLEPYIRELDFENDDSWYPGADDGKKNQNVHYA